MSGDGTEGDTAAASPSPALALRGAVGFLTRLPVGHDADAWAAFRRDPWPLVPAGYLAGLLVALPVAIALAVPVPGPTLALVLPVSVVAVTGINHADGVADLGDAAVVHATGETPRECHESRRAVMKDSDLGVGGTFALAILVAALALAGLLLAGLPTRTAVGLVVAAEVGAKLGLATLSALGTAPYDGFGAQLVRPADTADLFVPVVLALPAVPLAWPSLAAGVAVAVGPVVALTARRWARANLGGVSGDVFGATNELARAVALHVGVVAWTLS